MGRASNGPDTPQRNRNNNPDVLRAIPVCVSVKDGKISTDFQPTIIKSQRATDYF